MNEMIAENKTRVVEHMAEKGLPAPTPKPV